MTTLKQQWEYYCKCGTITPLTKPPIGKPKTLNCPDCGSQMKLRIKKEDK